MRNKIYEQKELLIKELEDGTFHPGAWDMFICGAGNKLTLKPEWETETSRDIRSPSHAWPYSVFKHTLTAKYRKSLLEKLKSEEVHENF